MNSIICPTGTSPPAHKSYAIALKVSNKYHSIPCPGGGPLDTVWPANLLLVFTLAAKLFWSLQEHFVRCFREDAPHCLKLVFEPLSFIISSARPVRLSVDVATLRTSAVVQEQYVVFLLFVSYMDVLLYDTTRVLPTGGWGDEQWLQTLPPAVRGEVTAAAANCPDGWREAGEHLSAWREAVQQSAVLAGLRSATDLPVALTPLEALRRMQAAMSAVPPVVRQPGPHQAPDEADDAATSRPILPEGPTSAVPGPVRAQEVDPDSEPIAPQPRSAESGESLTSAPAATARQPEAAVAAAALLEVAVEAEVRPEAAVEAPERPGGAVEATERPLVAAQGVKRTREEQLMCPRLRQGAGQGGRTGKEHRRHTMGF
ncbi:hypothetical protein HYH03_014128 [Edaphochlamys debaryana]|uniref:Uncharacterized protein n=1 Tax=Edaphochlamys debaryana TaxID=47281 RepID=A0A836BSM9_9CHLO|nr:hypothetical protein HYH03_014128 [Edaphochlamys debaryana]|eukprot:KAG2487287.1 hypothetical protein HYH03_014128 [Edaphochlamys debaryana]